MAKESTMPVKSAGFRALAESCLIPILILSAIFSNQQTWTLGPIIGQALGWAAILCSSVIVASAFHGKLWPLILIILIFIAKGFQIAFDAEGEGVWFTFYIILYGCLLFLAGAIMMSNRLNLVYKQLYIICLLNVIFMFMQVAGIADWSQFAATHADSDMPTYPIAFFDKTSDFDTSQRRPSGFTYSSQYLSIIALFGLVVHFSRKSRRFAAGTLVMCAMMVLSMAKLVFTGFIFVSLFVIISGNSYQRRAVLRGIALTILLVCLFAVLFPGIFESDMDVEQVIFSFSTRISNILIQYGASDAYDMLNDFATKTRQSSGVNIKVLQLQSQRDMAEDIISGYVVLIKILPYVFAAILALMPFYFLGLAKSRAWFPDLTTLIAMCLIIVVIIPSAGSLWYAPIYLFICGFALFPLFILLQHRHFKRIERAKSIRP